MLGTRGRGAGRGGPVTRGGSSSGHGRGGAGRGTARELADFNPFHIGTLVTEIFLFHRRTDSWIIPRWSRSKHPVQAL